MAGGGQSRAKRTNAVGGGDIDDVESSGPSRLAATAEASTRLPSGDVEDGAVFESGSYCRVEGFRGAFPPAAMVCGEFAGI